MQQRFLACGILFFFKTNRKVQKPAVFLQGCQRSAQMFPVGLAFCKDLHAANRRPFRKASRRTKLWGQFDELVPITNINLIGLTAHHS